jgi:hypothetical protein
MDICFDPSQKKFGVPPLGGIHSMWRMKANGLHGATPPKGGTPNAFSGFNRLWFMPESG